MPALCRPVMGGISSAYGWRYINGVRNFHNGLDFYWLNSNVTESRKVYSVAPGVVVDAGWGTEPGNYVLVDIGGGYKVRYIHLSSDSVTVGQKVGYSTRIGTMGDTGTATSPGQIHLHMDLYYGSTRINPEPYITLPFGYTGLSQSGLDGAKPIPSKNEEEEDSKMRLMRTTDGKVWFVTDNGMTHIASPDHLRVLQRLMQSTATSFQDFNEVERLWVQAYLTSASNSDDTETTKIIEALRSTVQVSPKDVAAAVLASLPASSSLTPSQIAAAVESALADNFAAIPKAVNDELKSRL